MSRDRRRAGDARVAWRARPKANLLNTSDRSVDAGRRRALALPALLLTGGWTRALPAAAQSALDVAAIERAAAEADLHGLLVWRSGKMLVELYRRSQDKPVGDWFA